MRGFLSCLHIWRDRPLCEWTGCVWTPALLSSPQWSINYLSFYQVLSPLTPFAKSPLVNILFVLLCSVFTHRPPDPQPISPVRLTRGHLHRHTVSPRELIQSLVNIFTKVKTFQCFTQEEIVPHPPPTSTIFGYIFKTNPFFRRNGPSPLFLTGWTRTVQCQHVGRQSVCAS